MTTVEEILKAQRLHKSFKERAAEAADRKRQEREARIDKECDQLHDDVHEWLTRLGLTPDELVGVSLTLRRERWSNNHGLLSWSIEGVSFRAHYIEYENGISEFVVECQPSIGTYTRVDDLADIGALL
jgi:hypothetical protein